MIVSIHPIALGGGTPLFRRRTEPVRLRLLGSEAFASGLVQLRYEILAAAMG